MTLTALSDALEIILTAN